MKLRPIEERDLTKLKEWRNEEFEHLRTPFKLNELMQYNWYKDVVSDRNSKYRFFAIECDEQNVNHTTTLVGYGALEISWENRYAELGLMIGSEYQKKGYGETAVLELLKIAFDSLNLDSVHVECYKNNKAIGFWYKIASRFKVPIYEIPLRKYSEGKYWNSIYFAIRKGDVIS